MKVYVYESNSNRIKFYSKEIREQVGNGFLFIGTLELPIEQPKKTVKKEFSGISAGSLFSFPIYAKNIKVTYEVEE